jgi:hypothetical protein
MRVILGFFVLLGVAVLTWLVVFFSYVGVASLVGFNDFEGAGTMAAAFFWGPVVGLIAGLAAMVRFVRRSGAKEG